MRSVNIFLIECGLHQLITKGTRLTPRAATCIDWIITDSDFIDVLRDLLSDHFPVFCVRKKQREQLYVNGKS